MFTCWAAQFLKPWDQTGCPLHLDDHAVAAFCHRKFWKPSFAKKYRRHWAGHGDGAQQILRTAGLLWNFLNGGAPMGLLGHLGAQFGSHGSEPLHMLFSLLKHFFSQSSYSVLILRLSAWIWWLLEGSLSRKTELGGASACFPCTHCPGVYCFISSHCHWSFLLFPPNGL